MEPSCENQAFATSNSGKCKRNGLGSVALFLPKFKKSLVKSMFIAKAFPAMKFAKLLSIASLAFSLFAVPVFAESCCDKAKAAGKDCAHPCCVEAKGKGEVCKKCNK